MFIGEYEHTVDGKGRVVLPAKFRSDLADGCVVTKGHDNCLYVFPPDVWQEQAEWVKSMPALDKRARKLKRAMLGPADAQKPDRQGRITLHPKLRPYAGIRDRVTIVGVGDRLEIWDADAWREESEAADELYSNLEEVIPT